MQTNEETRDKFYRALGELNFEFNDLEATMEAAIWSFIPTKDLTICAILTSTMHMDERKKVLSALFRHYEDNKEETQRIDSIMSKVLAHKNKRNTFVHGEWSFSDGSEGLEIIRTKNAINDKKRFEYYTSTHSLNKIREFIEEINKTKYELEYFIIDWAERTGKLKK